MTSHYRRSHTKESVFGKLTHKATKKRTKNKGKTGKKNSEEFPLEKYINDKANGDKSPKKAQGKKKQFLRNLWRRRRLKKQAPRSL